MSDKKNLESIKKLREITGVGFSDCKLAIDENDGDIDKSIQFANQCSTRVVQKMGVVTI